MTYLELEIRQGDERRIIPAVALAAVLRLDPRLLRTTLEEFLDPDRVRSAGPIPPEQPIENVTATYGEGGLGEGERSKRTETFLKEISLNVRTETFGGGLGEPSNAQLAEQLAYALDDFASLGGIAKLTSEHPRPLLEEALRRTLAMPSEKIRKSRGACFTGIVRTLARTGWSDSTHSHAHGP